MAWLRGFQSLLRNPVMIDRGDQAQCSARTIPLVHSQTPWHAMKSTFPKTIPENSLENYFGQHLHDSCGTMQLRAPYALCQVVRGREMACRVCT